MSTVTMTLASVSEAAEFLDISTRRVQQLCKDGRLGQKVGEVYIISWQELREFAVKPRPSGRPPKKDSDT